MNVAAKPEFQFVDGVGGGLGNAVDSGGATGNEGDGVHM